MEFGSISRLSQRKQKILAAVVDAYVETGEPVGSKVLAEQLGVSSATIRNEMADLAELGLLEQPHPSAGRIPSHLGYRVYIDHLMGKSSIPAEEQRYLDGMLLLNAYEPERLLENVSQVLAGMTQCAAVSTTPSGSEAIIRGVQFVQTSRRTAMVILMTSAGTMKNRIFRCDFDITPEMMRIFLPGAQPTLGRASGGGGHAGIHPVPWGFPGRADHLNVVGAAGGAGGGQGFHGS